MPVIKSFRIRNFRSIIDTNWVNFSPDGITVLVGQNESGKTSILQALHCALSGETITDDDKRIGAPDPKVSLQITINFSEITEELLQFSNSEAEIVKRYISSKKDGVILDYTWEKSLNKDGSISFDDFVSISDADALDLEFEKLRNADKSLDSTVPAASVAINNDASAVETGVETQGEKRLAAGQVSIKIHELLPAAVLFNAETGLLPTSVDINSKGTPTGAGYVAANNFLKIADIDLPELIRGDRRHRQNQLAKANERVSKDFTEFWSQVIGTNSKLSLKCEIGNYDSSESEKAGKEHLVFWISDGNTQLYPKQRSMGVRWFVSFYLQLRASEKSKVKRIFLLDEPGANLHSKAQKDVLKLINIIEKDVSIIYSTHSPDLIEYEKLYRVRAVQRDGVLEDSPTVVMDALHLGAASSDTLSPILAAMGSDMSHQAVIKKCKNVLLEEMSGYYYLKSFWKLTKTKDEAHFIASTGVNKLPNLVNMFIGWGLDFVVAVDDDKQGREVFNQIKKDVFGDKDELSKLQLLKIPACSSIEEAFSKNDFLKIVLQTQGEVNQPSNSEYLKENKLSKPVTAFEFSRRVEANEIKLDSFDEETKTKINKIVESICALLKSRP
jgi:predicted ATPase